MASRLIPVFTPLALAAISCSSPDDEPSLPSPPNVAAAPTPTIEIDGSYPDKPPYVFLALQLSDHERTATSLSVDRVELFTEGQVEAVATLHGELDPSSFQFADGTRENTYFLNPTELNGELGAACDADRLEVHLRGSACDCSIVVESILALKCLPDVRAGDLLAEQREAAPANKPCAMQRFADETGEELLEEEHLYGYDANGRLRLIDVYDGAGTLTAREVFSYEASGYLREELTINPESGLISQRSMFAYDAEGLLSTQQYDGSLDRVDGIVDWTAEYSLAPSVWTVTYTFTDPNQALRRFSYTYDESELTVTTDDNVVLLAEPLDSPNQFFALPEEVDTPKILSSGGLSFEYDDSGRLLRVVYPFYFDTVRDEYLYSCP